MKWGAAAGDDEGFRLMGALNGDKRADGLRWCCWSEISGYMGGGGGYLVQKDSQQDDDYQRGEEGP